ncbi:MAG: GNAT family N-acetyltransferase [Stigonema ocellatum SAG 48.90 = DSM 106950]|nr:GNAT family N-acetyltransferase [Stigonema ocellatum SAG 48.90 = DSM 106950]
MNIQIIDIASNLWIETLQKLPYDFYHVPEYVYIESKRTHSIPEAILITEDDKIFFLPYLVRSCEDLFEGLATPEVFDIVSPYGYPGILLSEAAATSPEFINLAIEQLKSTLSAKNVCSGFFRLHPILNDGLNKVLPPDVYKVLGDTVSVNLELSEAEIWQQTRNDHRQKINWCKRAGMVAKMVPFAQYIDEFVEIYEETMNRVGANNGYYFDYDYYLHLSKLGELIHLCIVEWEGQIICASLIAECCGIVQYHLSGTRNQFLKQAPNKFMLDYVRYWGKERGNKALHLGGGVGSAKDSLYEFKAGFSKQRHSFMTLSLVIDEEKYRYLVELRAKVLNTPVEDLLQSNFFPAYRGGRS